MKTPNKIRKAIAIKLKNWRGSRISTATDRGVKNL
jgi:hypothetical protein